MSADLINQIIQGGIAFAVLVLVVLYLKEQIKQQKKDIDEKEKDYKKQLEDKDKVIETLNVTIRDVEKENLSALFKVLGFMEKMDGKRGADHKETLSNIHEFRKWIEERLKTIESCVKGN
jgi:ribosomal protein S4